MAGLIGKKIGMTSIYGEDNKNFPCTVIEAGPCVITQLKTIEKDGYKAYQLGYGEKKDKNTSKAMLGHFKKAKSSSKHKIVEFDGFQFEEDKNSKCKPYRISSLFVHSQFGKLCPPSGNPPNGLQLPFGAGPRRPRRRTNLIQLQTPS